ncbi:dihydrolipoyl dehydrogenase [Methyloceanibacter sp. wino2]|uniref:dihydrolipoyl dehydrogenase n=1 Tax=Methyloceanibacter sp. wino2 TaxID=2170729 RepID=UPI000D3E196A|nr:dihydrolipoyl dehydrogenase [Methyloceanibacter sp. wino2]
MPTHVIVLGGGPAGYVSALHASQLGARVTLVDASGLGGTCLHRGCIPTKTLVSSCSLLDQLKDASKCGITINGDIDVSWPGALANVHRVINTMAGGIEGLLNNRKIEVINDEGWLADGHTVTLAGGGQVKGDYVLICTGSKPARPKAFPFDGHTVVTSDDLLHWSDLPTSLAIIGEGIIACEFAFIFASLGVKVTVVGMERLPAPALDTDISAVLLREMRKKGIKFVGGAPVESIECRDDGVAVSQKDKPEITAERALVCVGRIPNSETLHLEAAGVESGRRGEIIVDDFMRTSCPTVYAAGDVTGRVMLAHAASAQGKVAVEHILDHAPAAIDESKIPWAIFTSPEIGCVGLSEQEAGRRGIEVRCGTFDMRGLGKAQAMGKIAGMAKIVADASTGEVLGAHVMGAHATDIVHEAVVAIQQGMSVRELARAVHAHPTLSESVVEAAEDVFGLALHKVQ